MIIIFIKRNTLSSLLTHLSLTSLCLAPQRHSIFTSECSSNTKSRKHKDTAPPFPTTQPAGKHEKKKKNPKSNQTKERIKGEVATKWGREGSWVIADCGLSSTKWGREGLVGCGLSPTMLVGVGLWVVPLSRSHLSLLATPSEEMK
jgi:hypothetical protein